MKRFFILVVMGVCLSTEVDATVCVRTATAKAMDIRLSNGETLCARGATIVGQQLLYLPCQSNQKRFKMLPLSAIALVTDNKGNQVSLKQGQPNPSESNPTDKTARISIIVSLLSFLIGGLGLLYRLAGNVQNHPITFMGVTSSTSRGNENLAFASSLLVCSLVGFVVSIICGISSFTSAKTTPPKSPTSKAYATISLLLSGLMLLLMLL
jgi:hypothetical protein